MTPWSVCLSQIDYDEGVGMHEKTLGIDHFTLANTRGLGVREGEGGSLLNQRQSKA